MFHAKQKLHQWESIQQTDQNYILESNSGLYRTFSILRKIAPTDANVLLLGENGTGKYVLAEQIHRKSPRSKEPFVHIDLGSLPEGLFEAELFGYKKGAFTDAIADTAGKIENAQGGTVFLDEIGNLPLHLQAKLLTLIQNKKLSRIGETRERQMDVRFIFATNENLQQKVNEFLFRKDLYFRINTVEITIPPLRERLEDMSLFAQYFLAKYQYKYHKTLSLSEEDIKELCSYNWPGNIRELEHAMERSVILSDHGILQLSLPNLWKIHPRDYLMY
jgi:transcriptional regulator with PAS, ATPase and Fis domain